jgi:hypothetical protein
MSRKVKVLIFATLLFTGCEKSGDTGTEPDNSKVFEIKSGEILNSDFRGNGAQWGGYDFISVYTGSSSLSSTDWAKLRERVAFMRPGIVRIMVSEGWNYNNGVYDKSNNILVPILEFCQQNNIDVVFGEWGHKTGSTLDKEWLEKSMEFLEWLIVTKNLSCIKYFIMTNEPNGSWSTVAGNYTLWKSLVTELYVSLQQHGLLNKVEIMGPDLAYWNLQSAQQFLIWMTNTISDFQTEVTSYDIHAYPGQSFVRSGSFAQTLDIYKAPIRGGRDIFVTELGGKYPDEPDLKDLNQQRINTIPFTDSDSNTFIYDAFYGIDMADAVMQIMASGYASAILWDMDDAMYCSYNSYGAPGALKRWGFWNSIGDEMGISGDEEIRPWFYTISLLCRYFPKNSVIYNVTSPDKRIRAVACEKGGKFTVAFINSSYTKVSGLKVRADKFYNCNGFKLYQYKASINGKDFTGNRDAKGLPLPALTESQADISGGYDLPEMEGLSFTLITTME